MGCGPDYLMVDAVTRSIDSDIVILEVEVGVNIGLDATVVLGLDDVLHIYGDQLIERINMLFYKGFDL